MARIIVLAESGFGKTTSLGANKALNIKGLNHTKTMIIQSTNKGLPFPGNKVKYTKVAKEGNKLVGNLYHAKTALEADKMIKLFLVHRPEIITFVLDDFNFYMQDHYIAESAQKKNAFGIFNDIGSHTSELFRTLDEIDEKGKNSIILAHPEIYEDIEDRKRFKFKTVGGMVDKYVHPEARVEIVLMGKATLDTKTKTITKQFVTNDDGFYNAKTPFGMFEDVYIPNDMGLVLDKVEEYNNKVE